MMNKVLQETLSRPLLCRRMRFLLALLQTKTATPFHPSFQELSMAPQTLCNIRYQVPDVSHPKASPAHHKIEAI